MADFISSCACNGRKPRQLADVSYFFRNTLLMHMMRDRHLVRYLIAPPFFGKTVLAGSYAELMFKLNDTYWVNAQSPCFLRDIDAGVLVKDMLDHASGPSLAVFDDVSAMDDARRTVFWDTCRILLAHDWEVIVATIPAADPLIDHRESCIVLSAGDLMFTDADFEEFRLFDIDAHRLSPPRFGIDRVPGLVYRQPHVYERFLSSQIKQTPHAFDMALLFCLLVLEQGSFGDLECACNKRLDIKCFDAVDHQPYVRIDAFRHEFDATGFPLYEIVGAFTPYMQRIAETVGEPDVGPVVMRIADVLACRGCPERAAQLLTMLCEPVQRAAWLEVNQVSLMQKGILISLQAVFESLKPARECRRPALAIGSAFRLCLLDRNQDGVKLLEKIACCSDVSLDDRLRVTLGLLLFATGGYCTSAAFAELRASLGREIDLAMWSEDAADTDMSVRSSDSTMLYLLWNAVYAADSRNLASVLAALSDGDDAALAMTCRLRAISLGMCHQGDDVTPQRMDTLSKIVISVLVRCADEQHARIGETLLDRELRRFVRAGAALPMPFRRSLGQRCEAMEESLQVQCAAYARVCSAVHTKSLGTPNQVAASLIGTVRDQDSSHAVMHVKLFGGFDVKLGDIPVDHSLLSRQKVRTLLALLVLNCGKDLSCKRLYDMLWPESNEEKARHNFYTIWSLLHKAVSLPDGACPYLIRTQGVCRIDARLVHSDASDIEDLCHRMTFEKPDTSLFMRLFEQVSDVYRGELLPGEHDATAIEAARAEWCKRLTDAMLSAATSLDHSGRNALALRYAQQALAFDELREDAYRMVMELQVRNGLRPSAIDTWLAYNRVFSHELGLEPSSDMVRFYDSILISEAPPCSSHALR